jgi:RNA polymerase sigma factor (sigma-70 family)
MRQELPLVSDAYLHRLVRCNRALGDCLGFPIRAAHDYQKASQCLKEGTWPSDAAAKAQQHQDEFPWLPELFVRREPNQPAPRLPVWEQAAEDLYKHPAYRAWLYKQSRRYVNQRCPPSPSSGDPGEQPPQTPGDRAAEVLGSVLWGTLRIVVGKAADWQEKRKEQPDRTWLDIALDFARSEPGNEMRGEETGIRRKPEKPKADEPADVEMKTRLRLIIDTDAFPPGSDSLRPSEPETDRDETPAARAEVEERDRLLGEAVGQLPPRQQTVLRLRYYALWAWDQIAEAMGMTVYRVKQLHDAATTDLRRQLRRALDISAEE